MVCDGLSICFEEYFHKLKGLRNYLLKTFNISNWLTRYDISLSLPCLENVLQSLFIIMSSTFRSYRVNIIAAQCSSQIFCRINVWHSFHYIKHVTCKIIVHFNFNTLCFSCASKFFSFLLTWGSASKFCW